MTGAAKGDQVVLFIGAAFLARHKVVDLQEPGSTATRRLATVLVTGQDLIFLRGAG